MMLLAECLGLLISHSAIKHMGKSPIIITVSRSTAAGCSLVGCESSGTHHPGSLANPERPRLGSLFKPEAGAPGVYSDFPAGSQEPIRVVKTRSLSALGFGMADQSRDQHRSIHWHAVIG
jgi:hypothetical protein